MPTECNHTVLIEAFTRGGRGGESGGAEVWISAVASIATVDRVIVISSVDKKAVSEKEIVYCLPVPPLFAQWDKWSDRVLGELAVYARSYISIVAYCVWLWRAQALAQRLHEETAITVAIHCTYANLVRGSLLGRLRKFGVFTVTAGALMYELPSVLRPYTGLETKVNCGLWRVVNFLSRPMRQTDVVCASTPLTAELLKAERPTATIAMLTDPTQPLAARPKIRRVLALDRPSSPRKGSVLLRAALQSPRFKPLLPMLILSESPKDWPEIAGVEVRRMLSETAFEAELAASQFLLSASSRESGNTTVIRAAGAGCIPILTDIQGYAAIPDDCKVVVSLKSDMEGSLLDSLRRASELTDEQSRLLSERAALWGQSVSGEKPIIDLMRKWMTTDDQSGKNQENARATNHQGDL